MSNSEQEAGQEKRRLDLKVGLRTIRSYKRLSYKPWEALAEFVDNSTQSYRSNKVLLDAAFKSEDRRPQVDIDFDRRKGLLTIRDNAMGMSFEELERALEVGTPPPDITGRSRYGMGLKTAASWWGNVWTVRTKQLGLTEAYAVTVNVEDIADKNSGRLDVTADLNQSPEAHYTVIEIRELNWNIDKRTSDDIALFLSSFYRQDIRTGMLDLSWQESPLEWARDKTDTIRTRPDGSPLRKEFDFEVDGKQVSGWAVVLDPGGRSLAGFSILHQGRVIKGSPDAWRPRTIFGRQTNNLVNQRLYGEIELDDFAVTHTKDDILWEGDEEGDLEDMLRLELDELIKAAAQTKDVPPGPTPSEIKKALRSFQADLKRGGAEAVVARLPMESAPTSRSDQLTQQAEERAPDFTIIVRSVSVYGYLVLDGSEDDPYYSMSVLADPDRVVLAINLRHPFVKGMDARGLSVHLQHTTYDALSEWLAAPLDKDQSFVMKENLLRSSEIGVPTEPNKSS